MAIKKFTYGQIWQIAYPILVSALMEQLVGITDAAFLGRVGEVELGASAIGATFYIAIFMIGLGFSTGAQILMGRRNGEGNYPAVGTIFHHSLAFLLLLATVLAVLTTTLAPSLLRHIVSSEAVGTAAVSYLRWRVFGFFFAYVAIMFRSFYIATTNTRMLTFNSVVMVTSNILFNYILIFGKCGLPAFGIAGAAMGSVLAEGVSMLFFIVYTCRHTDYRKYGLDRRPQFRGHLLGHILGISVWTMIQDFISLSTWFIFFLAIEHLGERELAVTNVIRNISSVFFMTVIALSSTATTLVSNLMGQGEADSVLPMLRRTIRLGFFLLTPVLLLTALFNESVLALFTNETALIEAGRAPLFVLIGSYALTIPAQIYFHAVSGTGNTRMALCFEFASLLVYMIFVGVVIFSMRASLAVCWMSEYVYSVMAIAFSWTYMRYGRWRNKQI